MELQKRIDNVLSWDLGPIVVHPSRIKQGQDYQKVMKALCVFGEQFRERERVRVAPEAKKAAMQLADPQHSHNMRSHQHG